MEYKGFALGNDTALSVEREGLRIGSRFLDYADFVLLRPVNHRVIIGMLTGEQVEISMLGFSFDGFWEELTESFGKRSLEALFVEEEQQMLCEGEYTMSEETGRGKIALYPDSVCILPQSSHAVRIPLCFADRIDLEGYLITISLSSGASYTVGRMGYDTRPFAERAMFFAGKTKGQRARSLETISCNEPFTEKGLFRTKQSDWYWNAAFGTGTCALEFFTSEDVATYLYRFSEPQELFSTRLREATEASGTHRELIYFSDRQIDGNPLYRMAVARSEALRFLRARCVGRLIHSAGHGEKLEGFLRL